MNFKAWNMNKGLKRIWVIGSVFWFLFPFLNDGKVFGTYVDHFYGAGSHWIVEILSMVTYGVVSMGLWWGLLYLGFWVARGFADDDNKKAGF